MEIEELGFKIVRTNGHDEVLARAATLNIGRLVLRAVSGLYPRDLIQLRQGARIVEQIGAVPDRF